MIQLLVNDILDYLFSVLNLNSLIPFQFGLIELHAIQFNIAAAHESNKDIYWSFGYRTVHKF